MIKKTLLFVTITILLVALPLLGVVLRGEALSPYLRFPPLAPRVVHAPFSWAAFGLIATLALVTLYPFVRRVLQAQSSALTPPSAHGFPAWGWGGVALLTLSWWLAWNRFPWFATLQDYTFTPIWLGYVVLINALTHKRSGTCMLRDRPGYFLTLFPMSAAFWWFFEYLNRFVGNWRYVGTEELGAWQYFWQATLPFATVLPAVLGTRAYLATFPRLDAGLGDCWRVSVCAPKSLAMAVLLIAGTGLGLIGVWPNYLFSLLWVSPLLIMTALQALFGERTIFDRATVGDWRALWQAALAALACGFLWELWNYGSLTHWEYAVPWVHRFELFHMPALGYLGYLPFGLECLAVASFLESKGRR